MQTQAPGVTRATQVELSDQPSQLFSDSMLAASQISAEFGASNNFSPKAVRELTFTPVGDSTSPSVPDRQALQAPILSRLTVLSQQFLVTPQTRMTNSAVTTMDLPLRRSIVSPSASIAVAGQSMRLDLAAPSTEIESTGVQTSMAQLGGNPLKTQSKLNVARLQNNAVPFARSSKTRNGVANTSMAVASNRVEKTGRNASLSAASSGAQNSFPSAVLTPLSTTDPLAVWRVAPQTPSITVPYAGQDATPSAVLSAPPSDKLNPISNAAPNAVQSMVPNEATDRMQDSFPRASLNGLSGTAPSDRSNAALDSAPIGKQDSSPNADLSGLSNAASNTVQSVAANPVPNELRDSIPNIDHGGLPDAATSITSNAAPNASESTAQNPAQNWLQKSFLKAVLKAFASAGSNALSNAAPNAPTHIVRNNGQDAIPSGAHDVVPNPVQNLAPAAVLKPASGTPLSAEQLPVPHEASTASTKEAAATEPDHVSADLAISPATSPDQTALAASLSVPGATVDQTASPAQVSSGSPLESQASLSGVTRASESNSLAISATNATDGIKGASDDATSMKPHTSSASSQPKLQRDSQETAPTGDQGQNTSVSQGQAMARPEMNVANHAAAVVATAQAIPNTSTTQNPATSTGVTAHATKTTDNAAPASTAAPQALPVINTAKLIQSMGQSEMRVGMRSTEFGNISISTSATKDSISAQISLDHGELARTLATHLPEIQASMGGNRQMDVRIDMSGAGAGQTGTFSGVSNGSADQSRGGRQQAGNHADSSNSGNGLAVQQLSPAVSAMATSESGFNARLDIRI